MSLSPAVDEGQDKQIDLLPKPYRPKEDFDRTEGIENGNDDYERVPDFTRPDLGGQNVKCVDSEPGLEEGQDAQIDQSLETLRKAAAMDVSDPSLLPNM